MQHDDGALWRGLDVLQHALKGQPHSGLVKVAVLFPLHARVREDVLVVAPASIIVNVSCQSLAETGRAARHSYVTHPKASNAFSTCRHVYRKHTQQNTIQPASLQRGSPAGNHVILLGTAMSHRKLLLNLSKAGGQGGRPGGGAPGGAGQVHGLARQELGDELGAHAQAARPRQRLQRCHALLRA